MIKGCSTRQFFCFVSFRSEKNIIYKSGQPQEDPGKGQLKRFWSIKKYFFFFFFFPPTRFWVTKVLVQFKNDDNKIIYINSGFFFLLSVGMHVGFVWAHCLYCMIVFLRFWCDIYILLRKEKHNVMCVRACVRVRVRGVCSCSWHRLEKRMKSELRKRGSRYTPPMDGNSGLLLKYPVSDS